jgi:hypothetical protein
MPDESPPMPVFVVIKLDTDPTTAILKSSFVILDPIG